MIDEKKIEEAALKHSADSWLSDDCRTAFEDGFSEGINWFKENLWHDASEEPKDGLLLVEYYGGMMNLFSLVRAVDFKYPNSAIKRWLYIEDLMKGGK